MIGDFDSDILGAQAFGIKAVRVLWDQPEGSKRCSVAQWQFTQVTDMINWAKSF